MNNQTVEKLRNMRLGAMVQLHQLYVKENRFEGITCDEYLACLRIISGKTGKTTKLTGY